MTDTRTTELLPCPFCGGEAEIDWYTIKPYVSCTKCGCSMPDRHQTAEQAIEVWNTRTSEQTIPVMSENELTLIIEALTALASAITWTIPNDAASVRSYVTDAFDAIDKLKERLT